MGMVRGLALTASLAMLGGRGHVPLPFPVGETLEYDARLGMVPAGSASTRVVRTDMVRGQLVYVFAMTGGGGPPGLRTSYAMTSWTGPDPFTSRRFDRRVTLAGRTEEHQYEIVPDSLRYREIGGGRDWVTPADPLDELALLYYLRVLALRPGEARSLRGYFRNGYNPLLVSATGRESVTLGNGRVVSCVVLTVTAAGTTSRVWLTDDARRLPAQLDLPLSFGRVRLVLRQP